MTAVALPLLLTLAAFVPQTTAEEPLGEPADTITTGTVYAYGHELKPPYVLEIVDSTLRVNGVQVYPDLAQVREEEAKAPIQISEWTKKVMPVYRGSWDLEERLREDGVPTGDVTAQVAELALILQKISRSSARECARWGRT